MKSHRFFINQKIKEDDTHVEIDDNELIHQLKNVLRLKRGDKFVFVDPYGITAYVTYEKNMKKK